MYILRNEKLGNELDWSERKPKTLDFQYKISVPGVTNVPSVAYAQSTKLPLMDNKIHIPQAI